MPETLEQLRERAKNADIQVWPSEGARFPGDTAPFRYRRAGIEVGSLELPTEAECLAYLLSR